jgi:hypothetical protein
MLSQQYNLISASYIEMADPEGGMKIALFKLLVRRETARPCIKEVDTVE